MEFLDTLTGRRVRAAVAIGGSLCVHGVLIAAGAEWLAPPSAEAHAHPSVRVSFRAVPPASEGPVLPDSETEVFEAVPAPQPVPVPPRPRAAVSPAPPDDSIAVPAPSAAPRPAAAATQPAPVSDIRPRRKPAGPAIPAAAARGAAQPPRAREPGPAQPDIADPAMPVSPGPQPRAAQETVETAPPVGATPVRKAGQDRIAALAADAGAVWRAAPLVFDPRFRRPPRAPVYPRRAVERGEEGEVLLRVLVEADGATGDIVIYRSSGHRRLDAAARAAAEGWSFAPARLGTAARATWVQVPVKFRLD